MANKKLLKDLPIFICTETNLGKNGARAWCEEEAAKNLSKFHVAYNTSKIGEDDQTYPYNF